jgi:ribosomal protein S18 acetylase RimI-like enzyme
MMDAGMRAGMRRATVADAAAIARINVETWRATYAGMLPDDSLVNQHRGRQAAGWRRNLAADRNGRLTLVMEEAGSGIVGFASGGPVRHDGLPADLLATLPPERTPRGEIYTLYVDGDAQGHGYGRALLQGLVANLIANDLGGVLVWVVAANPARFFYEAMGGMRLAGRCERFAGADVEEITYLWQDPPQAG